jgi:uncharacterized protein (DUF2062 family)
MEVVSRFLRQRVVEPFREVVQSGISPSKAALTIAFGVSGGLFPVPAVTTLVCVVFALLLPVNPVLLQLVNLVLTPLQLGSFLTFIAYGDYFLGAEQSSISLQAFQDTPLVDALSQWGGSFARGVFAWVLFSIPTVLSLYSVVWMGMTLYHRKKDRILG